MSRPYTRPAPGPAWFLQRRNWLLFIIREVTSVALAVYLIFLIVFFARLGAGADAFEGLLATLTHPLARLGHLLALAAAVWHAVTWFNNSAQVMPMRVGVWRMPGAGVAILTGYAPWLILTLLVIWAARP